MPKIKKQELKIDKKAQIADAFSSFDDYDRLKDKKADTNAVKMELVDLLKEAIQKQLRKDYDPETEARIILNSAKGDLEIYIKRKVVEEVEFREIEIGLDEAKEIDEDLGLGDFYEEGPMPIEKILSRKSIQIIKQAVQKKVRDAERMAIYEECVNLVGQIVQAEVYQIRPKETVLTLNTGKNQKVEIILPNAERMQRDNPRKTKMMKVYIQKVERERMRLRMPDGTEIEKEREDGPMRVIASRTDDRFLVKLFESEVTEISEGKVMIKASARVPGERAKIAVESTNSRIDPVGACVGQRGVRIQNIVRELNNENIDVIPFSDENHIYIAKALQPAKIDPFSVSVDFKNRKARVTLKPDQIKYAIGKNGNNILLAEKLTGFEIEIYREADELHDSTDIDIIEFREEFGDDIVYQLLDSGLDTAKKVLEAGLERIEEALILPPKKQEEELKLFGGKNSRQSFPQRTHTRVITEEERRYWHRIAENIFRTIEEQYSEEGETGESESGEGEENTPKTQE
ncbi:MAG: transcription termination factor NusA [Chloroherpetonaceae bacterium]|nr:transcription termination factor NusA [Chloroherpetonaceae bacterium]